MSQQPYIDGFEFAASGGARTGRWPLRDLPRLQSSLAGVDGELEYALHGTHDPMGRRALQLRLRGVLRLRCQRCLEVMDFPLDVDAMLVLATSEAEIDADADDPAAPDRVLARREMPIRELIEDEVLLAIPFAPRHERCGTQHDALGGQRSSPFAALSAMLDAPRGERRDRRR
jgi:uncharacterized protein